MAVKKKLSPADKMARFVERFWSKVDQSAGELECWPWTGGTSRSAGGTRYGMLRGPDGKVVRAIRVVLWLTDGVPLSERSEQQACHKPFCANSLCVNPAHLEWDVVLNNLREMVVRRDRKRQEQREKERLLLGGIDEPCRFCGTMNAPLLVRCVGCDKWDWKGLE